MELPNDVATTTDSDGSGSESGEDDGDTDDSNYGVYSVASKNDYVPVQVKDKKKTKGGKDATGANNNEESSADQSSAAADWSQKEQKMLEQALGQFPKGTAERWDRIAGKVPGRSKNECMLRVRHLAELVQSRKQQQEKSGDEKPTTNGTASA